jgi:coenzyme F420-reducing hydrogenase beta subunit
MIKLLSPREVVRSGLCIGCGACVSRSSGEGEMRFDTYGQLKPFGGGSWLSNEEISSTCPFAPASANEDDIARELFGDAKHRDEHLGHYETAYVGYAAESDFRNNGSSGGMVTWVASELFRLGLVDGIAHVVAVDDPQTAGRFFEYRISRDPEQIRAGAKSRYYPIEMSGILDEIKRVPGRYAVTGIPCFIKAVQLLRRQDPLLRERIPYTLGLFCGHMKSAAFVESFAWQLGVDVSEIARVEFRHKDPTRPANWYNARLTLSDGRVVQQDWWHLADGDWGAGYFQNTACNYCDDVVAETADISFGDAWVEPYSSDGRGTNVVVVRSPELRKIIDSAIEQGRLNLGSVDAKFVIETQAAGFRQRRDGLGYRLSWLTSPRLDKRPFRTTEPATNRRKLIYRIRYSISKWSHPVFLLARLLRTPGIYIKWARGAAAIYHGLAYSRGTLGRIFGRFFIRQN